jgi:hypothetical protein
MAAGIRGALGSLAMTVSTFTIDRDGFAVLPRLLDEGQAARLGADLDRVLGGRGASALRSRGRVYGARNLIDVWPEALSVARQPALVGPIGARLGPGFGLVRSIFFDKPPGRSWSLPWHRDLTIAVQEPRAMAGEPRRPTLKAGVPHVEAPAEVLRGMLTARVALDDATEENGPLLVIPGSHADPRPEQLPAGADLATRAQAVHLRAGDVLLMRPLIVHRSGASHPGTGRHRRTLHFEFAPAGALPDGLHWHRFIRMP